MFKSEYDGTIWKFYTKCIRCEYEGRTTEFHPFTDTENICHKCVLSLMLEMNDED